jgi:alanine racemase
VLNVDLTAVAHNTREVRSRIGTDRQLFAVVKGDAYGFGLVDVARTVIDAGADALATVHLRDGIALRRSGIRDPILIYGGNLWDAESAEVVAEHDLITTIVDEESAQAFGSHASRSVRVFVKVDVGLERLGCPPPRTLAVVRQVRRFPNLKLQGIYTHLHVPRTYTPRLRHGDGVDEQYLKWQFQRFVAVLNELREHRLKPATQMAASSGPMLIVPGIELNAVDPGRLIYGLRALSKANSTLDLRPAFHSLVSRLIQVKYVDRDEFADQLPAGLRRGQRIGVIPIGLADGLMHVNAGHVLIRGKRARIIGMFFEHARLDLDGLPDGRVGDEVVIVGRQGAAEITFDEVIKERGLDMPAGLAPLIGHSVPRAYIRPTEPSIARSVGAARRRGQSGRAKHANPVASNVDVGRFRRG